MRSGPWNSCVSDPNQYFSGKGAGMVLQRNNMRQCGGSVENHGGGEWGVV